MSLNVLIVEDELDFREYVKHAIPWDKYDLRLIEAVSDVDPACDILRAMRIDLVLLDITLQKSNGLDLVHCIDGLNSRPRIVVITGHEEFETVRHALRLGVDDYLLKPFAKQELLMSILSNREHLLAQLKAERARASLQEAIVDSWLHQLIRAESSEEVRKLKHLLERYDVQVPPPPRILLCCSIAPHGESNQEAERRLDNVAAAWATAVEQQTAISWLGLDSRVYILMSGVEPSELEWEARDIAREFVKHAKRYLDVKLQVGLSGVISAMEGEEPSRRLLSGPARQAVRAERHASDREPVVSWRPTFDPVDGRESRDGSSSPPTPSDSNTLDSWYRMAVRFIDRFHHDPTLDVQTVAAHFGVSTEYLRRAFRHCGGTTCVQAIAGRRLQHARRLLTQDDVPVAEVATRSGFRDPAYFSRVFKRATGTTPAEYRRGARSYDPGWA